MSGCQLCHGLIRWHQKLLFFNSSFAKSEQGTSHAKCETLSILQEMLRSLSKSCYVSTRIPAWCLPWVRRRMLCYTHLGLKHMEFSHESEFRICQMRKDLLHTTKETITGDWERTTVSKELKRWHVHQRRNMAKELEKRIKRKVLPGLTRKQREQLCGLGPFTIFHSTANSEVQHLINLCFRVFPGVIPKPNP